MGNKEGTSGRKPPVEIMDYVFASASINYRLSHEATFPARIHYCTAAISLLYTHTEEYNIDPEIISVWRSSAGAHLAPLLGIDKSITKLEGSRGNPQYSSSVQSVREWYGSTDLKRLSKVKGHIEQGSPGSLIIGSPILEITDKVIRAIPLTYINKHSPRAKDRIKPLKI